MAGRDTEAVSVPAQVPGGAEIDEAAHQAQLRERLDALGVVLAGSRAEAIEWREQTGIEEIWREDQEFYEGVDDQNRSEQRGNRTGKPPYREVPRDVSRAPSSTVFLNITGPYVDASAARVGDMLLPTDDRGWKIEPTPIPDLLTLEGGDVPPPMRRELDAKFGADPDMRRAEAERMIALATDELEEARDKAERAQERIEDWHVQCQYHRHVREVIEDTSRIGSGALKGPYPEKTKRASYVDGRLEFKPVVEPTSRRIDVWNLFPEANCGEDIHNGGCIWERDDITRKQLEDLRGGEGGYLDEQIRLIIDEGPFKATKEKPGRPDPTDLTKGDSDHLFEIWYYHGRVRREDLEAAGFDLEAEMTAERDAQWGDGEHGPDEEPPPVDVPDFASAVLEIVNNRVIKAALNPLDDGSFPYDIMVWKKRAGLPWGQGIARLIRTAQRMVNGAVRMLMDNAGRASGPMLYYNPNLVRPANGVAEIRGWKIWEGTGSDADLEDIRKAISFITVEMYVQDLMAIIQLGLKFAEDVTGLPMILQGQMGQKAPDTLGGMQMLSNNAGTVLRRIARLFDDLLTEPHLRRWYRWVLAYGEDDERGDFTVNAQGSSALVERELQGQALGPLLGVVLNPAYGVDPKKIMYEFLKSQRLDTSRVEYDDEEWRQIVAKLAEGPQDQTLAVAEVRARVDEFGHKVRERIAQIQSAAKAAEGDKERAFDAAVMQFEAELDGARAAGEERMHVDDIRAMLGKVMLTLRTQKELAFTPKPAPQVAPAAAEPPGRAANGEGFQA